MARWYDPVLAHFLQADTVISTAGDFQSYSKYIYANNDPIIFSDPSGHKACGEVIDENCDRVIPKTLIALKKEISWRNGILLSDGINQWTKNQAEKILIGLASIETSFSKLNISSTETKSVLKGTTYYSEAVDGGSWSGKWNEWSSSITFYGNFPIELVLHEASHSIETRSGDYLSSLLESSSILTGSGDYVAGMIGGEFRRSELGFQFTGFTQKMTYITNPKIYTQLHRYTWESTDPAGEEIADMFMNFVMGSFENSKFGDARMEWMLTNVSEWVSAANRQ